MTLFFQFRLPDASAFDAPGPPGRSLAMMAVSGIVYHTGRTPAQEQTHLNCRNLSENQYAFLFEH
jgi:hypothetical protein